jgi:hypothetical protein
MPARPYSLADRALISAVVVVHVLFIAVPLDVLAPGSAHHVGSLVWHGQMPYRDFGFEYPPLALVAFLAPGAAPPPLAPSVLAFQALALEVAVGWWVVRHHPGALRRYLLLSLFVFPFLSGGFDAFTMATIAFSTALLASGRRKGWGVAALGALTKVSPATAWVWARTHPKHAAVSAVIAGGALAAPLALAPNADATFVGWSLHRGVQAESVAATGTWLARLIGHTPVEFVYRYRSTEIVQAEEVGLAVAIVAAAAFVLLACRARRIEPWLAAFASLLIFLCGFKVLSPQYLAWGAPLAAIVGGRKFVGYATAAGITTATYLFAETRAVLLGMTAVRNAVLVVLTLSVLCEVLPSRRREAGCAPEGSADETELENRFLTAECR